MTRSRRSRAPRPRRLPRANMCWHQASRLGLEVVQDKAGNTVVRKPAHKGREGATMALLQGHLDMVCEKNEGTAHNFDTDPIKVRARWRLAEGRRNHSGLRQRRRRGRGPGGNGEHRHRSRSAGVRLHHRRRDRPDRRCGISRRSAEVQVFPEPRQRREGHALHRLLGRNEDDGAPQGHAPARKRRRGLAHQGVLA